MTQPLRTWNELALLSVSSATQCYSLCTSCSCSLPHHSTFIFFFFFFGAPTLAVAESIHSHPSSINEWRVREAAEWITWCGNWTNDLPLLWPSWGQSNKITHNPLIHRPSHHCFHKRHAREECDGSRVSYPNGSGCIDLFFHCCWSHCKRLSKWPFRDLRPNCVEDWIEMSSRLGWRFEQGLTLNDWD